MVELLLFMIATMVAIILFDRYVIENTRNHNHSSSNYSEDEEQPRAERNYSTCSIFTVLGFTREEIRTFTAFRDHFKSYNEVICAMKSAGLEHTRLVIGVDFSASNEWQGRRTFKGDFLHALKGHAIFNPYQKVLQALGPALAPFLHSQPVHAYGFGDIRTKDYDVFPLRAGTACTDMADVLDAYNHNAQRVQRSGPTSLAPIIRRAIDLVKRTKSFHILLIITDGQLRLEDANTKHALIQASRTALSIIAIGVGDGPWRTLEEWDNRLTERMFDNFHFVNYHQVVRSAKNMDTALALHSLMEIPDQFQTIIKLGYLEKY